MGRDDLLAGGGGEIEVRLDSLEDADGTWAVLRLFGAPRSPPRRSGWWWRPPTWRASGSARSAYPSAGLLGRNIAPDSPAEAAGLRPGDLLVRVGGQELRSPVTLAEAIAGAPVAPSGRITLGVARNALGELEVELELASAPLRCIMPPRGRVS